MSFDCDTGPRDIIRQDVDGLLVDAQDAEGLVNSLEQLMSDEEMRKRFSEKAVEVRARFDIQRVAHKWEEIFVEISK